MARLELYGRQSCPYSEIVREKLDDLGVEYDETNVPEAYSDRDELESRTGQTGVPVLFDSELGPDEYVSDSDEIVSYLEQNFA
jgi:glutaredoxin